MKDGGTMPKLPLRKELYDFSRACEHLISAAAFPGAVAFTSEEIQWVEYYAKEMTSLVDRLSRDHKPQGTHERQTVRDYARTSEALLVMKNLSEDERGCIRDSVADVTKQILDCDQRQ
jgi:hypothetical protein